MHMSLYYVPDVEKDVTTPTFVKLLQHGRHHLAHLVEDLFRCGRHFG